MGRVCDSTGNMSGSLQDWLDLVNSVEGLTFEDKVPYLSLVAPIEHEPLRSEMRTGS
jgi:hypothetical protein